MTVAFTGCDLCRKLCAGAESWSTNHSAVGLADRHRRPRSKDHVDPGTSTPAGGQSGIHPDVGLPAGGHRRQERRDAVRGSARLRDAVVEARPGGFDAAAARGEHAPPARRKRVLVRDHRRCRARRAECAARLPGRTHDLSRALLLDPVRLGLALHQVRLSDVMSIIDIEIRK